MAASHNLVDRYASIYALRLISYMGGQFENPLRLEIGEPIGDA